MRNAVASAWALPGSSLGLVPTLPGRVELREGRVCGAGRACRPLIPDHSPMGAKDEGAPIFDSEFS
jgi:hypothetical protein